MKREKRMKVWNSACTLPGSCGTVPLMQVSGVNAGWGWKHSALGGDGQLERKFLATVNLCKLSREWSAW